MFDGITEGVEQGGIEVSKAFLKVVRATENHQSTQGLSRGGMRAVTS